MPLDRHRKNMGVAMNGIGDDDIISVTELAELLGKSVSWCYSNAAALGASKIGGSLIFRRSKLYEALDNAKLEKPRRNIREQKDSPHSKEKVRNIRKDYPETNPRGHGLWHLASYFPGGAEDAEKSEKVFEGIDLAAAMRKICPNRGA